jgi:beta-glucosidase
MIPLLLRRLAPVVSLVVIAARISAVEVPLYLDPRQPLEARVGDLLGRLTLDEKIALIHGDSKFTTAAIPRLGIPRRWLSDGPHGVREDVGPDTWDPSGHTDDFSTAMPPLIALAATWNPDLGRAYGEVLGSEARKRNKQILLGPGVNIQRTPLGGRNFEFLGEDPWLVSRMAVNYIEGVQSQGVAACVKHFAANNQETERDSIDVEMDERTLREIYLPAFAAAVKEGGVLALMGAYNQFRGQHCCENAYLLGHILKDEWGFKGLVVSDWAGTHHTEAAVNNGLDLEMGTAPPYANFYLARPFLNGIREGKYPVALLDDKVRRNLRVMFASKVFDPVRPEGSQNTPAHQAVARRVAEESVVLLKNEGGLLPLDRMKIRSVAVIGANATRLQAHSGGSSAIKAFYEVSPLEGILHQVGATANVTYAQGYQDEDSGGQESKRSKYTRLTGAAGQRHDEELIARAVAAAKAADVVILVGGLNHEKYFDAEGSDRKDLKLPYGQDELIRQVVAANPRTVVVILSGGALEMDPWLGQVPAVLQAWYGGMEGGNALASILFGDVNPSGKLPCTFPERLSDSPAHALGAYPGNGGKETYAEGLLVGYRWYDARHIEPRFPFGFGLSYTDFTYGRIQLEPDAAGTGSVAKVTVTNSGHRDGAETIQLYVRERNPSVLRPDKELKAFHKVFLRAGETQTVALPLPPAAFAFYDPARSAWVAERGDYEILAGGSSRNLPLTAPIHLRTTTILDR